jgi:choline dehydrogenase-like flavoprotein
MPRYESDICIIGSGISAALLAQKVSELSPGASIIIVEAGKKIFDFENRFKYRQRLLDYGENAWPGDHIEDQAAEGIISRTMTAGGLAMHFGAVSQRFSEEDLRLKSMYGLATDWPLEWKELERYSCEAERRMGVAGEPGPYPEDAPSQPYPMPPMELSWNLVQLKAWAEKSGTSFWSTPVCKNTVPYDGRRACIRCATCSICPTGARYSPDFTLTKLIAEKKIQLHDRTLIRKLVPHDTNRTIVAAHGVRDDRPGEVAEYHARTFIVASGYVWSSHLLLLSTSARYPTGIANSSGLVGRYMNGHSFVSSIVELDAELYPGMNEPHSLVSRRFFRCDPKDFFVRHDFRVWESDHRPSLRDAAGAIRLGDQVLADWRARGRRARARVRAYYDVHPDRNSALTLDPSRKNRYGDPMPKISHKLDAASESRVSRSREIIQGRFADLARHNNGKIVSTQFSTYLDHPAGGCRMGTDPKESVTDSFGRAHDHPNLFVVGAPTCPTAGCANGTLTFVALTLRSAERVAADARRPGPTA